MILERQSNRIESMTKLGLLPVDNLSSSPTRNFSHEQNQARQLETAMTQMDDFRRVIQELTKENKRLVDEAKHYFLYSKISQTRCRKHFGLCTVFYCLPQGKAVSQRRMYYVALFSWGGQHFDLLCFFASKQHTYRLH